MNKRPYGDPISDLRNAHNAHIFLYILDIHYIDQTPSLTFMLLYNPWHVDCCFPTSKH